jgi:hypothetical protein
MSKETENSIMIQNIKESLDELKTFVKDHIKATEIAIINGQELSKSLEIKKSNREELMNYRSYVEDHYIRVERFDSIEKDNVALKNKLDDVIGDLDDINRTMVSQKTVMVILGIIGTVSLGFLVESALSRLFS